MSVVLQEEEFVYTPGPASRVRAPRERAPKTSRTAPDLLVAPKVRKRGQRGLPVVIILLVVVVAAAALFLKPSNTSAPAGGPGTTVAEAPPEAETGNLADMAPVVFKYALSPGDTRTYDMSVDVTFESHTAGVPKFDGKVAATMTYNVVKQLENGASVVDISIDDVRLEPAPEVATPIDGSKMRVTIAPDGRVLYFEGTGGAFNFVGSAGNALLAGGADATDEAQSQFLFPRFPANAVKPGDTWTESSNFDLPFGTNDLVVTTTAKHDGFQESTYGHVAKMHHDMASPFDFSVTMSDLARIAQAAMPKGSDPLEIPSAVGQGAFKVAGKMKMSADTLVLPDSGDLVKLDGVMRTTMHMTFEGASSFPAADGLDFDAVMRMTIVRVNR